MCMHFSLYMHYVSICSFSEMESATTTSLPSIPSLLFGTCLACHTRLASCLPAWAGFPTSPFPLAHKESAFPGMVGWAWRRWTLLGLKMGVSYPLISSKLVWKLTGTEPGSMPLCSPFLDRDFCFGMGVGREHLSLPLSSLFFLLLPYFYFPNSYSGRLISPGRGGWCGGE